MSKEAYELYRDFFRDNGLKGFNILDGCPEELKLQVLLREAMLSMEIDNVFPKIYFQGESIPCRIGFSGEEI